MQKKRVRRRALLAKDQYPLHAVKCHLLAKHSSILFDGFSCLISSASSSLGSVVNGDAAESAVVLIPHSLDAPLSGSLTDSDHLLRQASSENPFPVVLVCDNPDAVWRRGLPANVLAVVENNESGVQGVRRMLRRYTMRFSQKIWLVGPFQQNLQQLYRALGFDVQAVDKLGDVEFFLQSRESETLASHVVLASFGKRCHDDLSTLPEAVSLALSRNDLFSMSVILDEEGMDLKPAWERRGVTVMDVHSISETQLINHISDSLHMQHQLAVYQYDAIRQPATGIYNSAYLHDSGKRLHAMACRGNLFFAVVIIKLTAGQSSLPLLDDQAVGKFIEHLQQHLRDDDVVTQQSADEFVCLLTSVGKLMLPAVLHRISHQLSHEFSEHDADQLQVAIGATAESSVTFDAMMQRAAMAVMQCSVPGSKGVVIL